MRLFSKPFLAGLLALPLAGCQSLGPEAGQGVPDEISLTQPLLPPFPEPEKEQVDLDGDLLFSFLVGEFGSRRHELELAYPHYMHVARLMGDAYAAEKATWIASYQGDLARLSEAVELWVSLAPNDSRARVKYAEVLYLQDRKDQALEQLDALDRIVRARGGDPFTVGGGLLKSLVSRQALLPLMQHWVAANPDKPEALAVLGSLQLQAGELQPAETSMRRAIELRPDWARPWGGLVFVLIQQGRIDEALDTVRQGIVRFPDDSSLRMTYGRMLYDQGAYQQALEQFRILQQQAPEDSKVAYMQGLLAVRVQAWDEARAVFQRLLSDSEYRDEAGYYLAQIEEQQGNTKLAMGLYGAVRQGSFHTDAGIRLAELEAKSGDLAKARERLAGLRVIDDARGAEIYVVEAGLVWDYLKDEEEVLRLYKEGLQLYPDNADLLYSRALHAAELGKVDQLEADLQQVLARQPDHADALNALGYTLADQTRRYQEAFEYVSRAYALKPDSPAVLDSMGWAHYRLGHYDEALEFLRKALDALQDSEIAAHLGEVLWVTGDRNQARRIWRKARDLDPDNRVLKSVLERFEPF